MLIKYSISALPDHSQKCDWVYRCLRPLYHSAKGFRRLDLLNEKVLLSKWPFDTTPIGNKTWLLWDHKNATLQIYSSKVFGRRLLRFNSDLYHWKKSCFVMSAHLTTNPKMGKWMVPLFWLDFFLLGRRNVSLPNLENWIWMSKRLKTREALAVVNLWGLSLDVRGSIPGNLR